MRITRAVAILLFTSGLFGQTPLQFEKVLVPVTTNGTVGASGGSWSSKLSFFSSVGQFRLVGINNVACPTCSLPPAAIPPNVTVTLPTFSTAPGEPPGSILYIDADAANEVHFALNVLGPTGFETPVPVVRERDLLSRTAVFPRVVNHAGVRNTLRIYNLDPELRHGSFDIQVFDASTHTLLDQRIVDLFVNQKFGVTGEGTVLPLRPEAAEIGINAALPELEIEVRPRTLGLRFWTFVTTTANDTQQVAVVTAN